MNDAEYNRGFWAILFLTIGAVLVTVADPITGGNQVIAGYVSLAVGLGFGVAWAYTSKFFDDDADSGRTK